MTEAASVLRLWTHDSAGVETVVARRFDVVVTVVVP